MIDDLPSATVIPPKATPEETVREYIDSEKYELVGMQKEVVYTEGLQVAQYDVLYRQLRVMNHLDITVEIHAGITGDQYKIVGFDVEPKSIDWGDNPCRKLDDDPLNTLPKMIYKAGNDTEGIPESKVTYTYSVRIK